MERINVPICLSPKASIPAQARPGDAGLDLFAQEAFEILPGEHKLIKTGVRVAVPEGYEIQVRPKSGLALKHLITVLNSPGTVDSGYRDEIGVILWRPLTAEDVASMIRDSVVHAVESYQYDGKIGPTSWGLDVLQSKAYRFEKGDKIAQIVIAKYVTPDFEIVDELPESVRGKGGFGHTGR